MPDRIPPKIIIIATVFVFLIVGVYLWQKTGVGMGRGGWVGVATVDGTTYFGQLVLADKKSVILRNVYTSAGYYTPPVEEGEPPEKPKFQVDKYGAMAGPGMEEEDTLTLPRSRVLFISKDVSSVVLEAIRAWTPPTPLPTPEAILEEAPSLPEEGAPVPSPAVEAPTPMPTPTPRVTPRATPKATPKP